MPRGSRPATVEVGAKSRKLDAGLRRAREKLGRFGKRSSSKLKKQFRGVGQSLKTMVGFGGVATFALAARNVLNFEKTLIRLRIQSGMSAAATGKLRNRIREMATTTGIGADAILAGTAKFVSLTGRMDIASASMETFAKVSAATGAEMEDIAATAAAMVQNLDIKPEEMEQAFSTLIFQGKKGAIELRELSSLMATVASQFPDFGKTGVEGLSELGASLQVVRQGFGSGTEAVTGFMGMMTAFTKKSAQFKKAGVETSFVDDKGVTRMRAVSDIIDDIQASDLGKNIVKLMKTMGRAEGARALGMLMKQRDTFRSLNEEGLKATDLQKDYAMFQESSAGKMARSWERLKNTIAKVFTPERIAKFAKAMEKVADAAGFIADHIEIAVALLAAAKIGPGLASLIGWKGMGAGGGGGAGAGAGVPLIGAAAVGGWLLGKEFDKTFGVSDFMAGIEGDKPGWTTNKALAVQGLLAKETDATKLAGAGRRLRKFKEGIESPQERAAAERAAWSLIQRAGELRQEQRPEQQAGEKRRNEEAIKRASDISIARQKEEIAKAPKATAAELAAESAALERDPEAQAFAKRQNVRVDVNITVDERGMLAADIKKHRGGGE